jgi:hypothetical protein
MVLLLPQGVVLHEMVESLKLKISDELRGKIRVDLGD